MSLKDFMDKTASEAPAPGGGSVSAYMGALGVSLGTMVANLSAHKKGWDSRWKEFSDWAETGKAIQNTLLLLVDEDTAAFNSILSAMALPKKSEEEKQLRNIAIEDATINAAMVPLKVMETAFNAFSLLYEMVEKGNPNSVTDAGVGTIAIRGCIKGAFLNVKINASGIKDKVFTEKIIEKGKILENKAEEAEGKILKAINDRLILK
jgi:glutamate formiminotransferase/formiminotetrahydrofolate cyclodeaminase